MASVNKVILIGNLGKDPEVRYAPSGSAICNITLATSRQWKDKTSGEKQEETEWHRVTCFNGLGKNVSTYVRKGMKVSVQGRIHYTKWQDQAGETRYGVEIYADEVNFLTRAPEPKAAGSEQPAQALELVDDIPF